MPITELDNSVALLVIDLQVGTLAAELAHPIESVVSNAAMLVSAFHARDLPVFFATVTGTPAGRTQYSSGAREFPAEFAQLAPGLEVLPRDTLLLRNTWSAFASTTLHDQLRALGVTQVFLTGVATSFGVESTARDAYDLGYSVAIATDAITDRSLDAHSGSVNRVFPALGQLGATAEITTLVAESIRAGGRD